jgi:hypothetical protein
MTVNLFACLKLLKLLVWKSQKAENHDIIRDNERELCKSAVEL